MGRGRKKKRNDATFTSKFDDAVLKSSKSKNARSQFDREAVNRKSFPDTTDALKASRKLNKERTNASSIASIHDFGKNFQENNSDGAIEMVVIDDDSPTESSVSNKNKYVLVKPVSSEITQSLNQSPQNLTFQEEVSEQALAVKKADSWSIVPLPPSLLL